MRLKGRGGKSLVLVEGKGGQSLVLLKGREHHGSVLANRFAAHKLTGDRMAWLLSTLGGSAPSKRAQITVYTRPTLRRRHHAHVREMLRDAARLVSSSAHPPSSTFD